MGVAHHKRPIVTDGLAFQVDAGNPIVKNIVNTYANQNTNGKVLLNASTDFDKDDNSFSFGMWVRPNTNPPAAHAIGRFDNSGGGDAFQYHIHKRLNIWRFAISDTGASLSQLDIASDEGEWQFIVWAYDSVGDILKGSVNNSSSTLGSVTGGANFDIAMNFTLNGDTNGNVGYSQDVQFAFFYDKFLSDAQINTLYNGSVKSYDTIDKVGLVSHWLCDEQVANGTRFDSHSSNDLTDSLSSIASTTENQVISLPTQDIGTLINGASVVNGSYNFDGINDYIDFGSITSADPKHLGGIAEFTISFIIKPTTGGVSFQRIVDRSSGSGGAAGWTIFRTGGSCSFQADTGATSRATDSNYFDLDAWGIYDIVINDTLDFTKFYKNGVLYSTQSGLVTSIPIATTPFRIGTWGSTPSTRPYIGSLKLLKISTIAFDNVQILQNYESQKSRVI